MDAKSEPGRGHGELEGAEDALERLRTEHEPIRQQLEGDVGMAPATRRLLVEHLQEEEREHEDRIALLRARGGGRGAPAPTVGSLRRAIPSGPAPRGTVGSLRPV